MTKNEKKIVERLVKKCYLEDIKVSRRSDREYDLSVEGKYGSAYPYLAGCAFSAWLPLMAIRELTHWPSREIASCTNHPDMVMEGDWSGVRDSEEENIWGIFHRFVL